VIGVGTRFSDFTTASKWIFQHPEVRFLNINVSNFDAWKLDGIAMLADAREAMTALDAALADSGWQAGWGAQIESVQSRQLKETQRVYQAVWQEILCPGDRRSSRSRIGVSRVPPDHRLHPDPEQRPWGTE
jgi:3D-(3,5/4)-trihydroxycyclohexane-1,2-dione acylhydrolase (decyclizing)